MLYIIKFKGCESINPIYGFSEDEVIKNMSDSVYANADVINLDCDACSLEYRSDEIDDGFAIMYYDDEYNMAIYENVKSNGGQICSVDDGSGKIVVIVEFLDYFNCVDSFGKEHKVNELIPLNQYGDEI